MEDPNVVHLDNVDSKTMKLPNYVPEPYLVTYYKAPWSTQLWRALSPVFTNTPFLHSNQPEYIARHIDGSWQSKFAVLMIGFLNWIAVPLNNVGLFIEWLLNFLHFNGGILKVGAKFIFNWSKDPIIWNPPKDSPQYYTLIGYLDPREELLDPAARFKHTNTQSFFDLCIMASKLAYESEQVQRNVVNNVWKMCYTRFYECWNDSAQANTTYAYIFTDKKAYSNHIFLVFRGTQTFNASNWCTDFDFSFLELARDIGLVHVGFLEALGLVNRHQPKTFHRFITHCLNIKPDWEYFSDDSSLTSGLLPSFIGKDVDRRKMLAFDAISKDLCRLITENPNAKLFITGHSLGAALALLFVGILMYKQRDEKEERILEKLSSIHTFGQPRIGDIRFAEFMEKNIKERNIDYYRVVYANDLISRIPLDNDLFRFKHVGNVCYYYDSHFNEKNLPAEPNRNFFSIFYVIPMYLNAIWELLRAVFGNIIYGRDFKEGVPSLIIRLLGLFIPGISAHFTLNYLNAVRVGPRFLVKNLAE